MATANARSDKNGAVNIETSSGNSLEMLPHFTIKEIEQHRLLSDKTPESVIIKTSERRQKFKNERYITASSDSVFTKCSKGIFHIKGLCKASMMKKNVQLL